MKPETLFLPTTRISLCVSLITKPSDPMSTTRRVEVFSAGCPICEDTIALVQEMACPSCEVDVLNMSDPAASRRAEELGVQSLPAVAVDGELAACCTGSGVTGEALQREGIGQPIA